MAYSNWFYLINDKTDLKKWKSHIYDIYKNNHLLIQNKLLMQLIQDLGIEKDYPEQLSSLPNKKKRNLELSLQEIEYNKNPSQNSIKIEHFIFRLKKFRILADIFRNILEKYNRYQKQFQG